MKKKEIAEAMGEQASRLSEFLAGRRWSDDKLDNAQKWLEAVGLWPPVYASKETTEASNWKDVIDAANTIVGGNRFSQYLARYRHDIDLLDYSGPPITVAQFMQVLELAVEAANAGDEGPIRRLADLLDEIMSLHTQLEDARAVFTKLANVLSVRPNSHD
jgi:hypothetical protein